MTTTDSLMISCIYQNLKGRKSVESRWKMGKVLRVKKEKRATMCMTSMVARVLSAIHYLGKRMVLWI